MDTLMEFYILFARYEKRLDQARKLSQVMLQLEPLPMR
tara:strand:- start:342 stop:455 length:114 start_codon:yes stop_codon:yes gene_type:complete